MVREGLRSLLEGDEFEIAGEACNGREATELVATLSPDVVLMDVSMPETDGLAALSAIKRDYPEIPVLMVSTYENASYIVRAIASGAAGYLLKGASREELVEAVRGVTAGESMIDPAILRTVVENLTHQPVPSEEKRGQDSLTERELEVLALVAQGLTNRQIGQILSISEGTARSHVQNIIQKLGVSDRTQAAVWAVKHRVVR